ncbi:MAG: P1 family peptidase [Proteobacteria bacterium]|nr:P1 family peptidase [Pseudomonadota bacterium]
MKRRTVLAALTASTALAAAAAPPAEAPRPKPRDDQSTLPMSVNAGEHWLHFDWPALRVGTGEYPQGPTGVTVFSFASKASAAVDVRGGSPGTVNTDYLRQGYDFASVDAVVFAGGSAYGLEATTAVQSAMKDDGLRGGAWDNIGFAVGAIIYDLGDRRLNEVYPDKRLAQAAYRAARPGEFPLGAHGAGSFAQHGRLFGCNVYSGEGGAFRRFGDLKIAAFSVVNAVGIVTGRDGRVAACYRDPRWPADLRTADLLARFPAVSRGEWPAEPRGNTTVSLVVVNRKLSPAQLQRLAAIVHTSMARAIQPFATEFDGDTLYAVSTNELEGPPTPFEAAGLDVLAAEVMWDAVLASVPEQPAWPLPTVAAPPAESLARAAGDYRFADGACLRIAVEGGHLTAQAVGPRAIYGINAEAARALEPVGAARWALPGRYPLQLSFDAAALTVNPGHWQQLASRVPACAPAARAERHE